MGFLDIDGIVMDDVSLIYRHVINYYTDLSVIMRLMLVLLMLVALFLHWLTLTRMRVDVPSCAEIKGVVFEMDGSSAPGLDGFTCTFMGYGHCFGVLGGIAFHE